MKDYPNDLTKCSLSQLKVIIDTVIVNDPAHRDVTGHLSDEQIIIEMKEIMRTTKGLRPITPSEYLERLQDLKEGHGSKEIKLWVEDTNCFRNTTLRIDTRGTSSTEMAVFDDIPVARVITTRSTTAVEVNVVNSDEEEDITEDEGNFHQRRLRTRDNMHHSISSGTDGEYGSDNSSATQHNESSVQCSLDSSTNEASLEVSVGRRMPSNHEEAMGEYHHYISVTLSNASSEADVMVRTPHSTNDPLSPSVATKVVSSELATEEWATPRTIYSFNHH